MAKGQAKHETESSRPSFEQALGKLESVVARLEEGQIGLDESLAEYQKGVKYLRLCYELLEKAERRVALLTGIDADGNPVTVDFDEAGEESLVAKAQTRSKRRSRSESNPAAEGSSGPETTDMDSEGTLF
ncbi:MAG: exodeoxyribonuclease VII small subunit [Planctomycetales bacterium]|nr:exodeoxyribonuclease VII small subunit [Planctomycetales bacterium]